MNPLRQPKAGRPYSRPLLFHPFILLIVVCRFWLASAAAAEPPPEIIPGQPCTLELALEPGVALADDAGFVSFRRSADAKALRFKIVPGLANTNLVSFESVERPGFFLRHFLFRLRVDQKPEPPNPLFHGDATFEVRPSQIGAGVRLRSFNYRDCYVAVTHTRKAYIVPDPDPEAMAIHVAYQAGAAENPPKP